MNGKTAKSIINIVYLPLQILLIILYIQIKHYFSLIGIVSVLAAYLLFLFYEHKKGTAITNFIRACVLITVLLNSYVGEYLELYETSIYFDKLLHVFGTFSFSMFIYEWASSKGRIQNMKKSFAFVFLLLLGSFMGTAFELAEFICDVIFKTVNQNGLTDTNVDMIGNILGAALAGILAVLRIHNDGPYID